MNTAAHQAMPQSTEAYRQSTKAQLWLDHRQKRCACNKVTTAKQLTQYGCCAACYKAAKSTTNTDFSVGAVVGSVIGQAEVNQ